MVVDKKSILAILMFGSLWGLLECTFGAFLHTLHLPAGAVMASIALSLMVYTRRIYQRSGMQFSMAFIASLFKLLNLGFIGGCVWCAMLAIIAEGLIFELMLLIPLMVRFHETHSLLSGAFLGYATYSGGYVLTEVFTPLLSSAGFFISDLIALLPLIFVRGFNAAFLSSILVFIAFRLSSFDLSHLRDDLYYALTSTITLLCWFIAFIV
ncbi:MAG: hypothetical protein JW778_06525 [Candidatus Altiarchaeota archaeon]|nr:hypothetical protein [Candidatus Altiarchaeota archaeon]